MGILFAILWSLDLSGRSQQPPQPAAQSLSLGCVLDSKGIFFLPGADLWFPDVLPEVGKGPSWGAMGALSLVKAEMARQPQTVLGGLIKNNVRAVAASWLPLTL